MPFIVYSDGSFEHPTWNELLKREKKQEQTKKKKKLSIKKKLVKK